MIKLKELLIKYKDILLYLVFGALTTLVNFAIYTPLNYLCDLSATISNIIAWIGAVAFAYFTNKPFVFKSNDWSVNTVLPELGKFVGCRFGSGLLETVFLTITVDVLMFNSLIMKVIASVVVVILNYIASKLIVFKKRQLS